MATSRAMIANHFEIDMSHPLGVGGMALVYRGRDLRTGRDVAIKTLRPEYSGDPESRARFRREARLMAFVKHPNLVTIYDLHEESNGSWVVMEYVPGPTLKALITEEGPMSPEVVLPILEQLADAFSQIHGNNLVHLDIKPQNIIVRPDGIPKLIDFGLAQPAGAAQQTANGVAFGTVAYLAPEQATGDVVDATTDIYSLGCVVYEMLTGRPPFVVADGPDHQQQLIRAHIDQAPVAPSHVRPELQLPRWVDDVIGWALAKDRKDRYHDVSTFARMFRSGLEGEIVPQSDLTSIVHRQKRDVMLTGRLPARHFSPDRATEVDDDIETFDAASPSMHSRLYQAGGRMVKNARRARRMMWRLAMVFAIGNLLLGLVLVSRDGPSALVERFLSIAPGTQTSVIVDHLNVREAPGTDSEVLVVLPQQATVKVTGLSETVDGERWWPIEFEADGVSGEGWAWDGGLQPNAWTGRMSWMQSVVDNVNDIRDGVTGFVDEVGDLWPLQVSPWGSLRGVMLV